MKPLLFQLKNATSRNATSTPGQVIPRVSMRFVSFLVLDISSSPQVWTAQSRFGELMPTIDAAYARIWVRRVLSFTSHTVLWLCCVELTIFGLIQSGHNQGVRDICFNTDGTRFISASYDKYIKLWDTETGKCISRHTTHKIPYCVKLHPDKQNECLVGQSNKKIVQWDLSSNKV